MPNPTGQDRPGTPRVGQARTTPPRGTNGGALSQQSQRSIHDELAAALDRGVRAVPQNTVYNSDLREEFVIPGVSELAGTTAILNADWLLPSNLDDAGYPAQPLQGVEAGQQVSLETGASGFSRAVSAGCHLIDIPQVQGATPSVGVPILQRAVGKFCVLNPIEFERVEDDVNPEPEVTPSTLPWALSECDANQMTARACQISMTRREWMDHAVAGRNTLASALAWMLTEGIGRAIDATLFEHLNTLNLAEFTRSSLAASQMRQHDVTAIHGTTDMPESMYAVDQGCNYISGIPLEYSPDLSTVIAGSWRHSAVMLDREIPVYVWRGKRDGALEVTAWLRLQAMVPDQSKFWAINSNDAAS